MPQSRLGLVPSILFYSRWPQLPLYLGLIVAPAVHVWSYETKVLVAQTSIHITFLISALAIAAVDRLMPQGRPHAAKAAARGSDHSAH